MLFVHAAEHGVSSGLVLREKRERKEEGRTGAEKARLVVII